VSWCLSRSSPRSIQWTPRCRRRRACGCHPYRSVTSTEMRQVSSRRYSFATALSSRDEICRILVLASGALLFLHDAGTIGVSYTIRISYVLMGLACVIGVPVVLDGWRAAPGALKLAALFLVVVYIVSGLAGVNPVLSGQARASRARWLVYIVDLGLGLAAIGLIRGLFLTGRHLRQLILVLGWGVAVAAGYGIYQWFAQHYGWPLANLDNAPNSEGLTVGSRFQGLGILGWERVRSTWVEPFYFGTYLAALLPIAIQLTRMHEGYLRWLAATSAGAVVAALVLTDSSLAWASLAAGGLVIGALVFVTRGRPVLAGVVAAATALLVVVFALTLAKPNILSPVTERSNAQLGATVAVRTTAWREATAIWAARPVLGYGPGASSVKLAHGTEAVGGSASQLVLGSAQGIWAASLIDAGVLGLIAWAVFFGTVLHRSVGRAIRQNTGLVWWTALSATIAVAASQVGGDRVDLHVWVLIAVALVAGRRGVGDEATSSQTTWATK
jgi:O-Antigen ligase